MKYITTEGLDSILSDRSLVALAPSTGSGGGTVAMDLLEKVNTDAVAEIDGYLRGIYPLPLPEPVDQQVSTICGDIMKFRLYKRRDEKAMPENVLTMYKLAVSKLEKIQKRIITLDIAVPAGEPAPDMGAIKYHTPTQKFGTHFTGFDGL